MAEIFIIIIACIWFVFMMFIVAENFIQEFNKEHDNIENGGSNGRKRK